MPNWCSDNLSIKGNVLQVLQFIEDNFENMLITPLNEKNGECVYVLDFEVFAPTPKDENGEIIESWYEWRNKEWGCKWSPLIEQRIQLDIYKEDGSEYLSISNNPKNNMFNRNYLTELFEKEEIENMEAQLVVYFETPWCPPYGMFKKWIEKYTELELRLSYYEPGCCFAGVFHNENKEFNVEEYGDGEVSYIEFLLNEGFEELDYYKEDLEYVLNEINKDSDREFATRLVEKVNQTLDELEDNFSKAMLIADIRKQLLNIESEEEN